MTTNRLLALGAAAAVAATCVLAAANDAPAQQAAPAAQADPMSPLGVWTTIDDNTGKPKSLIKIWERNGKIFGTIVKLINPKDGNPNPLCDKCSGDKKDKPIVGMTIMNGLTKDGDEWSGGTILDPESGSVYKVYIQVLPGGKKLKVRGYVGISLLGRTQYWVRSR